MKNSLSKKNIKRIVLALFALSFFAVVFLSAFSLAKYIQNFQTSHNAGIAGINADCIIDRSQFYFQFKKSDDNTSSGGTGTDADRKRQIYVIAKGQSDVSFTYSLVFNFSDWSATQYEGTDAANTITPDNFNIILKQNFTTDDGKIEEREIARSQGASEKIVSGGKTTYAYTITCDYFRHGAGAFRDEVIMEFQLKDDFEFTENRRDEVFSATFSVYILATQINEVAP